MDRISQTMPPFLPLPNPLPLNLFVCCTCLLDTFQPRLFLFALSIPKSLSSLDCLDLINLKLNLETYFSKTPRTRGGGGGCRQNGLSDPCLSSFIYLFEKREVVTETLLSLLSPKHFSVFQLNIGDHILVPEGPI